jgi:hypothetical protein
MYLFFFAKSIKQNQLVVKTLNIHRYLLKLKMDHSIKNYIIYKQNNDIRIEHKRNCLQISKFFLVGFN